jgi:ADP-ribosyl-[dinitrogen reductase] hydrolase
LGGDVDTLGAITGALMGARLGMTSIPPHLVETVLDRDALRTLALRYHALVTGKG